MVEGMHDHPLRAELTREVHARPYARLQAPERATHLALVSGEGGSTGDRAAVAALCARYEVPGPDAEENFLLRDLGPFRLRWERHTEFSTYTFFSQDTAAAPFVQPVIEQVPRDWLESLPGDLLVGVHLELEAEGTPERDSDALYRLFGSDNIAGSLVSGGSAAAWMDFTAHADGYGRILLRDLGLTPHQTGRLVQRLLEIETYRMMALLALPLARRHGETTAGRLTQITGSLTRIAGLDDEQRLLGELTALSAGVEEVAAATSYRFGAARAYYALVGRRVEELRETRVQGLQTIAEFIERRLAPAMRTCEAVADRLDALSRRVTRAGQLLRARVDVQLEAQNRDLLASMDRRARLQLRLQETVEGLSVAAITYYLASLVGYLAKALRARDLAVDPALATGISVPVIAVLVWFGVRRVRRRLARESAGGQP